MVLNLFFSNNYQQNLTDFVSIKQFNVNSSLVNYPSKLTIQLPSSLIESELITPYNINYQIEDTYYEDNLYGDREDPLYYGSDDLDNKTFYRVFDNDLATSITRNLIEFPLPDSYLLLTFLIDFKLHELYLPIPIKEGVLNYYIDSVLTYCPFNVQLGCSETTDIITILNKNLSLVTEETSITCNYALNNNLADIVTIENLPNTRVNLNLVLSTQTVSLTTNYNAIEYYPKILFSESTLDLEQLAYSLYIIKDYREDYNILIESIIARLQNQLELYNYYLHSSTLNNNYTDNFEIEPPPPLTNGTYSYYKNAFMVLSLLSNYDPVTSTSKAKKYFNLIVSRLSSSINIYTGFCNREISLNKIPIILNDIPTTVIVYAILEFYLASYYNSTIEYLLYILDSQLELITTNNELLEDLVQDIGTNLDVYFHLGLWLHIKNKDTTYIKEKIKFIVESINPSNTIEFITPLNITLETPPTLPTDPDELAKLEQTCLDLILKVNYITSILSINISNISLWEYQNHLTDYSNNVWGLAEKSLYYSAWVDIINNQKLLWSQSSYQLNYTDINIYLANIFQKTLKYIPVNEPWFDTAKLEPSVGLIGLVLKSASSCFIPLIFEFTCYSTSLDINKAYGIGLDKWGVLLNLERESNESDLSYRKKLKVLLDLQNTSKTNLQQVINSVKESNFTRVETQLPTDIIYQDNVYSILSLDDLLAKAQENDPVGVNLLNGDFFEFSRELGVAKIISYENRFINNLFLKLQDILDVPVILKIISGNEFDKSNTVIY